VREEDWPPLHEKVLAAIDRYRVGERIEFGASIVLASGVKA